MKIEDPQLLKRIIEGALMAAEKPLNKRAIKELFDDLERPDDALIDEAIEALQNDCEDRGYELKQVASGYRYQVEQGLSKWVSKLWKERTPRYSRALLETLSLIAYRQPITRGEIESIRGVAVSSNIIRTLLEREWIKAVGYRDVPGRPAIYATTKQFLDYFNLKSLDQLPPLAEVRDLNTISREFNIEMPAEMKAAESANDADIVDGETEGLLEAADHANEAVELDAAAESGVDAEFPAENIAQGAVDDTIESNEPKELSEQHEPAAQPLSDLELVGRSDDEARANPATDESAAFGDWLESELSDNASAAE
jgi:segregation and condensation protein B